jgi:hypothetical protein
MHSFRISDESTTTYSDSILNFESKMSQIYIYFGRSTSRSWKLKCWQEFLGMPELKFKRIFSIRWSSIRDCIKPILVNTQPSIYLSKYIEKWTASLIYLGSQALLTCLKPAISDRDVSKADRKYAKELLDSILDDEFLFLLHMNYDLHESVLAKWIDTIHTDSLTTFRRLFWKRTNHQSYANDHLSYFDMMNIIKEKRNIFAQLDISILIHDWSCITR